MDTTNFMGGANKLANESQFSAAIQQFGSFTTLDLPASARPFRTTVQSGLPLHWSGDAPAASNSVAQDRLRLSIKRAMDIVLSILALVALGPLLIIIALAIKLTSAGPVYFKQTRLGRNGTPFETLKFRSMRYDECDASGIKQTTLGDSRVTAIGRFIRRTSIDELPQLLNILRGDMSLIGPRPHVAGMLAGGVPYEELVPYYALRLAMKPGLSGWAQANGLRGPTDNAASAIDRVDHDIAYIQNFSILLDLKIIFMTLHREFVRGGSGD